MYTNIEHGIQTKFKMAKKVNILKMIKAHHTLTNEMVKAFNSLLKFISIYTAILMQKRNN